MLVEGKLDKYIDALTCSPNSVWYKRKVKDLTSELDYIRYLRDSNRKLPGYFDKPNLPTHTQEQTQLLAEPVQQIGQQTWLNPERPVKKICIQSLLSENTIVPMITGRFTVSLFIRDVVGCLKPFFGAIISLALLVYGLDNISLIIESYKYLASLLGEQLIFTISMLFWMLYFLFRLLLVIRKANKSSDLHDKLFDFKTNNYLSGLLYFYILLMSVGLVYLCGCDSLLV